MTDRCPKCGRFRTDEDPSPDECPRCGVIYARYHAWVAQRNAENYRFRLETARKSEKPEELGDLGEAATKTLKALKSESVRTVKGTLRMANLRDVFRVLIVLAVLFFLVTGISIFSRPEHEVMYRFYGPTIQSVKGGGPDAVFYVLELACTGRKPQPLTVISLRRKLKPHFTFYGRYRSVEERRRDGGAVDYELRLLEPGVRLEMGWVLDADGSVPPSWEELLAGVRVEKGKAHHASPVAFTVLRTAATFTLFDVKARLWEDLVGWLRIQEPQE